MSDGTFKDPLKEFKELSKSDWKYEWYPPQNTEHGKNCLYYIEFLTRNNQTSWTLFKKNYLYTPEVWAEMQKDKEEYLFMTNEVHPYNLGGGIVNERENAIDINTVKFLKYLVDSLNLNVEFSKQQAKLD